MKGQRVIGEKRKLQVNKRIAFAICLSFLLGGLTFGVTFGKLNFIFPQYHHWHEYNTWIVGSGSDGEIDIRNPVECTIEQWRDGILIYRFGDSEVMTNIGKNFTAMKLSGDTDWDTTDFAKNVTYLGFGDQGSLSASSTQLPSEAIRFDVSANFTYISLGKWNYTGYWYPTGSGTTDCCGMYWGAMNGDNATLYCYDTFGEISYTSDDTIISKWQFTITYS